MQPPYVDPEYDDSVKSRAPRWPEAELRQGTPEVIDNHREVIKTRGRVIAE